MSGSAARALRERALTRCAIADILAGEAVRCTDVPDVGGLVAEADQQDFAQ